MVSQSSETAGPSTKLTHTIFSSPQGNDGGTVVRRADLVRVKEDGRANVDPAILNKVLATTCCLSSAVLANPVVSDSLGRLYNKDSVVKYLLKKGESDSKHAKSQEDNVAGHLRGLKDVKELRLAPNLAASRALSSEEELPAPFACPLTQREMNGKHRFVYLATCGCVMSESGLRAVVAEHARDDENMSSCPNCGSAFSTHTIGKRGIQAGGDVVIINGTDAEIEAMREEMEKRREVEIARKKELKSQSKDLTVEESNERRLKKEEKRKRKVEVVKMLEKEEKRVRRGETNGGHLMPTTVAGIVAAEAKMQTKPGKEMSAAMRSIYGLDKPKQTGETWMTRGTFNRFA
ncbi:hypothetical protein CBS101457_005154 [Exobasidium rhododendri]|nr:hypothetical protein CBS101457_005154 [Exobasidium rhododendri]